MRWLHLTRVCKLARCTPIPHTGAPLISTVRRSLLAFAVIAIAAAPARAQDPNTLPPAGSLPETIAVYLDCTFCDFDFIRTEIPYVNWVRDPAGSDVHLLMTRQSTGGGGNEYVLNFIGQRGFARMVDTLKAVTSVTAMADDQRKAYTRTIKTGLVPFLARTKMAERLTVAVTPASANAQAAAPQRDPWKAWVMTLSSNGYTFGEKSYHYYNGYFYTEAKRITKAWKSTLGGDFSYNQSEQLVELGNFDGTADTTYYTIRRRWSSYGSQLKAINEHFSAGLTGTLGADNFNNQERFARVKAALEYNLFPYSQSTRRQLRVQYGAGMAHYNYQDTTIWEKTQETIPIHYASIAGSARQPWGSLSGEFEHNALLLEPSKRNTQVYGNASIRVIKGLNFNVGGSYSWIHDQLFLRKGTATKESVLLRQQALKTSYFFDFNFGLSYTFGSIFNNVVFPRFGGSNQF